MDKTIYFLEAICIAIGFLQCISCVNSAKCWSNLCQSGEEFCVETCAADHLQCLAHIRVRQVGTVEPVVFECINEDTTEECQNEQCVLTADHVDFYSCCCTGDLCNSVYGVTPGGGDPPIATLPTVSPTGTIPTVPSHHEVCEFYNCSRTSSEGLPEEPCYHGYVACADDPIAEESYPNHTHHYCGATYQLDQTTGLYSLYHKGCRFSPPQLATDCTPGVCEVVSDDQDTDIACCCDGQLCNVNIIFDDPSVFEGFVDPCKQAGCNSSCLVPSNGEPVCFCANGYILDESGTSCVDMDECDLGMHLCVHPAVCKNTVGSHACDCPIEYRLTANGTNCERNPQPATGLVCHYQDCNTDPCSPSDLEYCDEDTDDENNIELSHQNCHALYELRGGVFSLLLSSCLLGVIDCADPDVCVLESLGDNLYHCCCESNLCNTRIVFPNATLPSGSPAVITVTTRIGASIEPTATTEVDASTVLIEPTATAEVDASTVLIEPTGPPDVDDDRQPQDIIIFAVISTMAVVLIIGTVIMTLLCFAVRRKSRENYPHTQGMMLIQSSSSPVLGPNLHFIERIGQGRFASVWKAKMGSELNAEIVAVKVFSTYPRGHLESFEHELSMYQTSELQHKNILRYIANERLDNDLYLILAHHPHGSLYDLLKNQQLTLSQFCKLSQGAAAGLAHLHSERIKDGICIKPPIAHRDLKSKNILVMADWSACISDFGLAIKLDPGETPEAHGQVGTARYMAPEVLEGAIHFQREAFQRIDVYALALIMWEMASRTQIPNATVGDYSPPFQEWGASPNPSIEEMKSIVVVLQRRPEIPKGFMINSDLDGIVDTIQESWDQDAEARLSAQCIEERVRTFRHSKLGAAISKDSGFTDNQESLDSSPQTPSCSSGSAVTPVDGKAPLETGGHSQTRWHMEIDALNCSPRNQRYSMNIPDNNASRAHHRMYNMNGYSTETTV